MNENECLLLQNEFRNQFNIVYSCRRKNKKAKRESGGIIVFIKHAIKDFITLVQNSNEDFIWLKIDKMITGNICDIYLCCAYISPRSSCR